LGAPQTADKFSAVGGCFLFFCFSSYCLIFEVIVPCFGFF